MLFCNKVDRVAYSMFPPKKEGEEGRGGGTKLTSWFAVKLKCFLKSQRTQKISGSCFKTCVLRWFGQTKNIPSLFQCTCSKLRRKHLSTYLWYHTNSPSHPCSIFPDKKRGELVWYRDLWDFSFKIGDEKLWDATFPSIMMVKIVCRRGIFTSLVKCYLVGWKFRFNHRSKNRYITHFSQYYNVKVTRF